MADVKKSRASKSGRKTDNNVVTSVAGEPTADVTSTVNVPPVERIAEINASLGATIQGIGERTSKDVFTALAGAYVERRNHERDKMNALGIGFEESAFWADDSIADAVCKGAYLIPDGNKKNGDAKFKTDTFRKRVAEIAAPAIRCGIRSLENFEAATARHEGSIASFVRECFSFSPVFALVNKLVKAGLLQASKQQRAHRAIVLHFGSDTGATGAKHKLYETAFGDSLTSAQIAEVDKVLRTFALDMRKAKLNKTAQPEKLAWATLFVEAVPASNAGEPTATTLDVVTQANALAALGKAA